MAKRFTDTEKWKKKWIRSLDAPYKVFWLYLLDDCNHAGVWEVDIEIARIKTGCIFDEKIALEKFIDKIQVFDDGEKWFIPDFIEFQYGKLKVENRVHLSVIDCLIKYKNKGLISPLQGVKDKDKDKDKDSSSKKKAIPVTERMETFKLECKGYKEKYSYEMCKEFFIYWSELTPNGNKMLWETKPTWETHKRLVTWSKKTFNK
ncbi:MAG: hypothetical protein QNK20_16665 [Aureibaculum sp.]|nr:hypothetical protein [Aureibaculum sp.]